MYPATHWGLDKNLVMGEFWAVTTDSVNGADLYTNLYTSGYNGAWAWNYDDQRRQRRQPVDSLAGHEDADAEPLQRADGDARTPAPERVDRARAS